MADTSSGLAHLPPGAAAAAVPKSIASAAALAPTLRSIPNAHVFCCKPNHSIQISLRLMLCAELIKFHGQQVMAEPSDTGAPAPSHAVDLSGENVHWDLRDAMSYADYLRLVDLLACQKPLTGQHDETLFIVIHQASELWIKLCLHAIAAALRQIREDALGPAFKMMARVARVQVNLIQSWEILSTMTPFRSE